MLPLDARCTLMPDSTPGSPITGQPDTHPTNGAPCQSFNVPATVPNKNGATITIQKDSFVPIVLHGILDTVTSGGGGFECDVFRLQRWCNFEVTTPQPITFNSNGGSGSFEIKTGAGCTWDADEDSAAEDWVKGRQRYYHRYLDQNFYGVVGRSTAECTAASEWPHRHFRAQ